MINRAQLWCVSALCVVSAASTVAAPQRGRLTVPRVTAVYVSAADRDGASVGALTPDDIVLKEGGTIREIVKVESATAPMHIALIVDDGGTGIFRFSVAGFIDQLLGSAQFSIARIVNQVQNLVTYTSDVEQLRTAVLRLQVTSEPPRGGQVVEGIFEAARDLQRREVERGIIVVLTVSDAQYSSLSASHVLDQLRQSGALLYVISIVRPAPRAPLSGPTSTAAGATPAADKPSDLLERQIDINRVLGDGPKQSGGRIWEIAGLSGRILPLQMIADELSHQYRVTYIVPAGERPDQKISVSSKRRGVSMRAPSRLGRGY